MGTDGQDYSARPEHLVARSTMQLFVERPSVRRFKGSDRWRYSGGNKGATDHWIHANLGMRRKYGKVFRASGRPPLKFMQYSLLRTAGADRQVIEDTASVLWTVDGTEDELELPAQAPAVPDSVSSVDSLTRNIDLASEGLTGVLVGMPRKLLPKGRAHIRSVVATQRRGEAARVDSSGPAMIDVEAALSADPHLFASRASSLSRMMARNPLSNAGMFRHDSDPLGSIDWQAEITSSDWSATGTSSDDNSSDSGTGELPSAELTGFTYDCDDANGFEFLVDEWDSIEQWDTSSISTTGSHTPPLSESAGPGGWHETSDSSDRPFSPDQHDVSLETPQDRPSLSHEQEQPAWVHEAEDEPSLWQDGTVSSGAQSVGNELKRKLPQLESLENATRKKGRVGPRSAFAVGVGLCMIFIGRLFNSEPAGTPSNAASTSMCQGGHVKIAGAVGNSLCLAAPEGSNCPYECLIGFHQDGLHTCVRTPSGSAVYSGGACVPDHVCSQTVYLENEGNVSLAVDEPSRPCTWDLVCTNETLSPVLTFSSFSLTHGNLSIRGGLGSADYDNVHNHRLGQRRRSQLPPDDETILHGTDTWWISQPITVAQSTARVAYNADLPGQDFFTAKFSCGSYVEHCTLTDELELDWTTLQHPERPAATLPSWFFVPPDLVEPVSGW